MFQYLTKKHIGSAVFIAAICLVGDKNSKPIKEADLGAAICDNITHAWVAMMIWGAVANFKLNIYISYEIYLQMLACGLCSSLIDIDHFIMARSFSLKDATRLRRRPFLHCSSGAFIVISFILTMSLKYGISWLYKFSWILAAAFMSHHIRDSTRKGFWIWPFGSTKRLPYAVYVIIEALLPHIICHLQSEFDFATYYASFNILEV